MAEKVEFWKLVWNEHCYGIVTLLETDEAFSINICGFEQNWKAVFSSIRVELLNLAYKDNCAIQIIKLQQNELERRILHLQWRVIVPVNIETLLADFRKQLKLLVSYQFGPVLLCSRDGRRMCRLYIALDMHLKKIESGQVVRISDCMDFLRTPNHLLQNERAEVDVFNNVVASERYIEDTNETDVMLPSY